jgi:hypothetical protein
VVDTLAQLVQLFGVPVLLAILYGPPSALVVYFLFRDWKFTGNLVELMTKIALILEIEAKEKLK